MSEFGKVVGLAVCIASVGLVGLGIKASGQSPLVAVGNLCEFIANTNPSGFSKSCLRCGNSDLKLESVKTNKPAYKLWTRCNKCGFRQHKTAHIRGGETIITD